MEFEETPPVKPKRILWIFTWVIVICALVLVGSWLFPPREDTEEEDGVLPGGRITETDVRDQGFQPEAPSYSESSDRGTSQAPDPISQRPFETAEPPAGMEPPPTPDPSPTPMPAPAKPAPSPPPNPSKPEAAKAPSGYAVQLGAFSTMENAERMIRKLKGQGFNAAAHEEGGLFKVVVPGFASKSEADAEKTRLKMAGFTETFTVHLQ